MADARGLGRRDRVVLKQDPTKPANDRCEYRLEPGIIAKLKVVSVASTSAVCEVVATARDLAVDDVLSLPDAEVEKMVEKNLSVIRGKYPDGYHFSEGDPLEEEVRDAIPRPPLPEVNQMRGRIGFDMSTIQPLGQGSITSTEYGMVLRADFTRMFGTHWNLNGYWRGTCNQSSTPVPAHLAGHDQSHLPDESDLYQSGTRSWTAGIGRLYLPWASSLETIDGGYVGKQFTSNTVTGIFGGSTPDPTSWSYNPQGKDRRRILQRAWRKLR